MRVCDKCEAKESAEKQVHVVVIHVATLDNDGKTIELCGTCFTELIRLVGRWLTWMEPKGQAVYQDGKPVAWLVQPDEA